MKTCPKCNIPIQEHGPGACLDALFAEKVMGWEKDEYNNWWIGIDGSLVFQTGYAIVQFHPSTNIAHAMEGVERAIKDKDVVVHLFYSMKKWQFLITDFKRKGMRGIDSKKELAITRALVLRAMEKGERSESHPM